jgi:PAS domain S-box-containing protein
MPSRFNFRFAVSLVLAVTVLSVRSEPSPQLRLTAQEREWLLGHPVVTVAPDPDFPPIEWFDERGKFSGIAAEYVALVQKQLGITFKVVREASWDDVLAKARAKEIDVLSAAAQTPQRAEYLLFSEPHVVMPGVIITRKQVNGKVSLSDLKGMKVALVSGYLWQEFISRDFPDITLDPVPDVQTGMRKVSFAMDDAMIENLATATTCIEKEGITNLKVAGETGYSSRLSFAVRNDWPELRSILDKALASIDPAEKKAIFQRWVHIERQPLFPSRLFWFILAAVLAAVAFVIVVILLWNRALSRQVGERTREISATVRRLESEVAERQHAEAALRESERKFIEMVEHANSIILRMDTRGTVTFFNRFAREFFGFSGEEILGKNIIGTIVPETETSGRDLAALMDDLYVHPERYAKNENENIRKNGERVWISWSNKPILGKDGKLAELLCVGNDITDLKAIEAALKSERDFASAIFETAGALALVFDRDGGIVRFNRTCELVTGYGHGEVIGKRFWDIFLVPEETAAVRERFAALCDGNFPNSGENYWRTKSGGLVLVSWFNTVICDEDGKVAFVVSTGIDITERRRVEKELDTYRLGLEELVRDRTSELSKTIGELQREIAERRRAEEALSESERRYRFLFDCSPAGSVIVGPDGRLVDINKSFEQSLGYRRDEIVGGPAVDFIADYDKERVMGVLRKRFLGEKVSEEIDTPVAAKDGSIHYINFAGGQAQLYDGEKFVGMLITGIDVTERRKAEELARQQRQKLIQADKMATLGVLVSGVAHEINNPNNFIILNSDNLADIWKDLLPVLEKYRATNGDFMLAGLRFDEVRDEVAPLIAGISEGAKRIRNIVQNLKDFARQEPGDLNQMVPANAVVDAATLILSNLIKKSTDRFVFDAGEGLPSVKGAFQKIEQVVINLISNACQALTSRNQAVRVSTAHDPSIRRVTITVSDEGAGISPENLKHIMDPFFTTKRDSGGTGLGLAISYNIVKDHGGELSIASEAGKGTVATVSLPSAE